MSASLTLFLATFALASCWETRVNPAAAPKIAHSFGPIDIGFAQWMSQHHDQAILMAQTMIAKPSSKVGRLALSIQTQQLVEVGHMQAWLMLAGRSLLPESREMAWMLLGPTALDPALASYIAACKASAGAMPGMASTDELNALRQQEGEAADRLFVDLMLRHHRGGIPMATFAASHAETPQVRALAASMRMEQNLEIGYMETILRSRLKLSD